MITPGELKSLYEQGKNISAVLRERMGIQHNTPEIIELSYDLQTGSYIAAMGESGHGRAQARLRR
jgi:ABC-type microcin C transport system duplicated ATPase subunit YejF